MIIDDISKDLHIDCLIRRYGFFYDLVDADKTMDAMTELFGDDFRIVRSGGVPTISDHYDPEKPNRGLLIIDAYLSDEDWDKVVKDTDTCKV